MACFNHPDRPSIGGCKGCGRSLCTECFSEVGKSLACKNRCEEDVRAIDEMLRDNIRLSPLVEKTISRARKSGLVVIGSALFIIVVGCICVWLGYVLYVKDGELTYLVFGALILSYGLIELIRVWLRTPRRL